MKVTNQTTNAAQVFGAVDPKAILAQMAELNNRLNEARKNAAPMIEAANARIIEEKALLAPLVEKMEETEKALAQARKDRDSARLAYDNAAAGLKAAISERNALFAALGMNGEASGSRTCGNCGGIGHNSRTCQK